MPLQKFTKSGHPKRISGRRSIAYDRGDLVAGSGITVREHFGLPPGPGFRRTYDWTASRDGLSVPGYYDSRETALYAARSLTSKYIREKLGDVYAPDGLDRAVTMADIEYVQQRWPS
jgi:hypothetical protein